MKATIVLGKNLDDMVEERAKKAPLSKKMDKERIERNRDENISTVTTYLPLVEQMRNEAGVTVSVYAYEKIPDSAVSHDEKKYEQSQVIVGQEGLVIRTIGSYSGKAHAEIRCCYSRLFWGLGAGTLPGYSGMEEELTKTFICEAFSDTKKNFYSVGGSYKDIALLVSEDYTESSEKKFGKSRPDLLRDMPWENRRLSYYELVIKRTLEEIGYKSVETQTKVEK